MKTAAPVCLNVSIPEETLHRLLAAGQLCAAELHCLDMTSRRALRRLCLESCMGQGNRADRKRRCRTPGPRHAAGRSGPVPAGPYHALPGRLQPGFGAHLGGGNCHGGY